VRRAWIALIALVACEDARSTKPQRPGDVQATEVVCQQSFPGGRSTGGPSGCREALERFLVEHADHRILDVVPIEAAPPSPPDDPTHLVHEGTQRLVVIHHDGGGPGELARDLAVSGMLCHDGSRPVRIRPQDCRGTLHASLEWYDVYPTVIWVPLTGGAGARNEPGTHEILTLKPRKVSRPDAGR
jgi:hypothetical protein